MQLGTIRTILINFVRQLFPLGFGKSQCAKKSGIRVNRQTQLTCCCSASSSKASTSTRPAPIPLYFGPHGDRADLCQVHAVKMQRATAHQIVALSTTTVKSRMFSQISASDRGSSVPSPENAAIRARRFSASGKMALRAYIHNLDSLQLLYPPLHCLQSAGNLVARRPAGHIVTVQHGLQGYALHKSRRQRPR